MKLKKFLSHIYSNGRFFNIININKESICTNSCTVKYPIKLDTPEELKKRMKEQDEFEEWVEY